jgi:hypothetical protein
LIGQLNKFKSIKDDELNCGRIIKWDFELLKFGVHLTEDKAFGGG